MSRVVRWLRTRWRVFGEVAFYVCAGATLLGMLLFMVRGTMALHADGLWGFSFVQDLLNGMPIHGWKPSALPLYFPEMTSILVLRALGFNVPGTILVFGVFAWGLIGVGVWWGARLSGVRQASALRAAFVLLLLSVFLHARDDLFVTFQNPFSHGGATLGTFIGLIFIGRVLKHGVGWRSMVPAALCLALLVSSDLAIVVQLVFPAVVCLLAFGFASWVQRKTVAWLLGTLVVGTIGGRLATFLIQRATGLAPEPLKLEPSLGGARQALARMVEDFSDVAARRPLLLIGVVVPIIVLGREFVVRYKERKSAAAADGTDDIFGWWLTCSALTSLCGTLASVVVSDSWAGIASHRYILPVIVLPAAFAMIVGARRLAVIPLTLWRPCELGLLVLLVVVGNPKHSSLTSVASAKSSRQACLDSYVRRENLHVGYAQFWHARPLTVLSSVGLTINQVGNHWEPYSWLNNAFWYSRGYWPRQTRPLQYDFTITNGLDERWLVGRFGEPRVKRSCFDLEIWVYDRPEDVEFRNYLRSYAARATADRDGWWESPTLTAHRASGERLTFEGSAGIALATPRVPADVIEVDSPTRRPLTLFYRSDGINVAHQKLEFAGSDRRLIALPVALDAEGFDSVLVKGDPGVTYELSGFSLLEDRRSFTARPAEPGVLNREAADTEGPRQGPNPDN